jgi:ribosomal protein S25
MNHNTKFEEEVSDTLSTSTPNSGHGDMSPERNFSTGEDGLSQKSKKIRKKRSAYQKIDDDIRVKLLEAVQQRGETLKSAAKRYGINYSSAKSILHTYRKEGRILKKSAQDRNGKRKPEDGEGSDSGSYQSGTYQANYQGDMQQVSLQNIKPEYSNRGTDLSGPSSPMNKLTDNFVNLLQINQQNLLDSENNQQKNFFKVLSQPYMQNYSKFHPQHAAKVDFRNNQMEISPMGQPVVSHPQYMPVFGESPMSMYKTIDNFYINYSNSPLSTERIVKQDGSSKSTGRLSKEFDSFTDMINALQKKSSEELKDEIHIPRPLRFNTAHKFQEQIEAKINGANGEDKDWKGTIENAALDTFRTVVDAQILLCDALKKANFLNNLVQLQKNKDQSP